MAYVDYVENEKKEFWGELRVFRMFSACFLLQMDLVCTSHSEAAALGPRSFSITNSSIECLGVRASGGNIQLLKQLVFIYCNSFHDVPYYSIKNY